ncbi:MAG: peptidyl-prolyl cis-trans isomerase, partial [Pseudomonadota bacterium]
MRTFLREPLLHFLLAAVLLFAAYSVWEGRRQADKRTIFVPEAELERLGAIYAAEAGSLPGPMEARGLVADYVRREALAREARRLGLDQHDLVVDRRLEQKMVFMVADLVDLPDPGDDTLKAWFDAYPGKFEIPARVTFDHVYFRDPDDPRIDAAPAELAMAAPDVWRTVGDPFMLQRQYGDLPLHEVARLFG